MDRLYSLLPDALLGWYQEKCRALPWRVDRDPYHVWVSEIMLQQTRVEAVKEYYKRFLQELPSIYALSECDDEHLCKLWEGLGYYNRVRNMKKAAQIVVQQYGGVFPKTYEQVLSLPGIGEYTAGAICSICYNAPVPAVDGNVLRVISRITDDRTPIDLPALKKQVKKQLMAVYPDDAGDFTQALMELGATVCGPNKKPLCDRCPCSGFCLAYKHNTAEQLPVKLGKKQRRVEEKTVFLLCCDGKYALKKRPGKGLLAGLWQFPDVPGILDTAQALSAVESMGLYPTQIHRQSDKTHVFTHVQWNMRGFYLDVKQTGGDLSWFTKEQLEGETAIPTAYRQFWNE